MKKEKDIYTTIPGVGTFKNLRLVSDSITDGCVELKPGESLTFKMPDNFNMF